jgi:hypothetical protein
MQEWVVPLIAAGSTILGTILGGALTLSADHLKATRDERARLRELRLQTYSRFLRTARGQVETSLQRVQVSANIADRKEKGESTGDLDNELNRLEAYSFESKELLAELEIIAAPSVLEAANELQEALEKYDSATWPVVMDIWALMAQGGKADPTDETKRHSSDLSNAQNAVNRARALFSDRAKRTLGLQVDGDERKL